MALKEKKVIFKIYSSSGTYLTTWNDQTKKVEFSWAINGGLSNLSLQLARTIDNFGESEDVALFNRVKVYISDKDSSNYLLYDGYITAYRPFKGANEEYIDIEIYPYLSELSDKILKDADDKTTLNYLTEDPSDILRSLLVNFKRDGGKLYYTDDTIDDTGTNTSYEFKLLTYGEAVNKIIELCPYLWYWYAGNENIYLKHADLDTIDHNLMLGREVKSISPWKKGGSIYNVVYFVGNTDAGLYKKYERSGSISEYGRLEQKINDDRVSIESTADTMANRFLDENDHPELTFDIEVVDNNGADRGYDIESFRPGDVVSVKHPHSEVQESLWDTAEWDVDYWDYNIKYALGLPMTIRNINYDFDTATITCSTRFPEVSKRIEDINRNLNKKIEENVPDTPTT